jgi:hypothetical protein
MKPYLLFCGDDYYPLGGWDDFRGSFDTLDEAKAAVPPVGRGPNWGQIVYEGAIVTEFRNDSQEWRQP